jgi:hypothetical protein
MNMERDKEKQNETSGNEKCQLLFDCQGANPFSHGPWRVVFDADIMTVRD